MRQQTFFGLLMMIGLLMYAGTHLAEDHLRNLQVTRHLFGVVRVLLGVGLPLTSHTTHQRPPYCRHEGGPDTTHQRPPYCRHEGGPDTTHQGPHIVDMKVVQTLHIRAPIL
jgi:hypothetical protein